MFTKTTLYADCINDGSDNQFPYLKPIFAMLIIVAERSNVAIYEQTFGLGDICEIERCTSNDVKEGFYCLEEEFWKAGLVEFEEVIVGERNSILARSCRRTMGNQDF